MNSRLECRNLTKDYGNVMALSDVNLTLESGRIVGLLGPNGSGKTTMIKLANGLLQPTSGEILLNGLKPGPETKSFVSYLPDANYLPDWMNIDGLVGMFADFYADFDREKAKEMIRQLNLREKDRLKTLSKGNKEKVQLILAMSRKAEIYFLDEPIGGKRLYFEYDHPKLFRRCAGRNVHTPDFRYRACIGRSSIYQSRKYCFSPQCR